MNRKAFNLIEIMVVTVIIAFGAAIAMSSYRASIAKGKWGQVQPCLTDTALRMENFRSNYGTYPVGTNDEIFNQLGVDPACSEHYVGQIFVLNGRYVILYADSAKAIWSKAGVGADQWAITDVSSKILHVGNPLGGSDTWPTGYSSSGPPSAAPATP